MELKEFILAELQKLELNGIKVVDLSIGSTSTRFVIAIEHSIIDFVVNNNSQFQTLSVVYKGKKYVDAKYLAQFDGFVADVIRIVQPVVERKKDEYDKDPDMLDYREEQAKLKEEQLEKRSLTIQAREQLLEFQTQAIDVESQFLEEEKVQIAEQVNWLSVMAVVALMILAVSVLILTLILIIR